MTALLELTDVTVAFGGLRAVDEVSLRVEAGAVVGLIGPNGAGKSTLIDAITGFVPVDDGSIAFDGQAVTRRAAHRRARDGLVRTFQSLELFEDLTTEENIGVAASAGHGWRSRLRLVLPGGPAAGEQVDIQLAELGLGEIKGEVPVVLSQADRRNLALARALVASPRLLLLDEPAAGLDAGGAAALGERLRSLAGDGLAILLVDHDMTLVLSACDYVYVVEAGRLIAEGTPAEVRQDPEVLRAYLGEEPPTSTATGGVG